MKMYLIIISCVTAIISNIYFFYLKKEVVDINPKRDDIFCILRNKNIIAPENGKYKTIFFFKKCVSFWYVAGVNQLKKENYKVYSKEIIKSIPSAANKACFTTYKLCAFWLEGEEFEDFYLIDIPWEDKKAYGSPTLLLSPKLMKLI